MYHISAPLKTLNKRAEQAKFWANNQSIFLRYFDSEQEYNALINAGNFAKISKIVKDNTTFKLENFIKTIQGEK